MASSKSIYFHEERLQALRRVESFISAKLYGKFEIKYLSLFGFFVFTLVWYNSPVALNGETRMQSEERQLSPWMSLSLQRADTSNYKAVQQAGSAGCSDSKSYL